MAAERIPEALEDMLKWVAEGKHTITRYMFVCFGPETTPTHRCTCGWRGTMDQAFVHGRLNGADWK